MSMNYHDLLEKLITEWCIDVLDKKLDYYDTCYLDILDELEVGFMMEAKHGIPSEREALLTKHIDWLRAFIKLQELTL